jgi:predicted DNA-binding transcriptional regulator AlpA
MSDSVHINETAMSVNGSRPSRGVANPSNNALPTAPRVCIEPGLLRAPACAAFCSVSEATWWRWHSAGRCPAPVRIGGTVRWRAEELRDWVRTGCPDRTTWEAIQAQRGGRSHGQDRPL